MKIEPSETPSISSLLLTAMSVMLLAPSAAPNGPMSTVALVRVSSRYSSRNATYKKLPLPHAGSRSHGGVQVTTYFEETSKKGFLQYRILSFEKAGGR